MTMGKTKKKDHRSASLTRRQSTREVKQSFLIVCEGVRTEPDYFKAFRMTAATVKAVGQAMNTTSLVSKAISIRDADQKKKRIYDQCWVVFDKDDFPAKDFNEAIALAERNGFKVALQRGIAQEQLCRHAVKTFRNTLFQDGRIRGYYV